MQKFLSELQRRKVLRVASGYVVAGWVILQVALSLQAAMKLPDWFATVIVSLLMIGFPIALIVSWFFEFTPDGIRRTAPSNDVARFRPQTADFALAAGLLLVLAAVVVQLTSPPTVVTTATEPKAGPAISAASIAVLPFADLSPAKDQEYFSDGMAEEILNVLAKVQGLDVASRTSSFQFKGREIGIPEIAKKLSVRHVLEGSVRKAGNTLRITAQLIDTQTDRHLWSETFDRPLTTDNIFTIQDEIAQAIVKALNQSIGTAATAEVTIAPATSNLTAYDLFLQARPLFAARVDLDKADQFLTRALELDPKFAKAWEMRAALQGLMVEYGFSTTSLAEVGQRTIQFANRALAIDPQGSTAIAILALHKSDEAQRQNLPVDFEEILAQYDRALAIDPRNASVFNWRGATFNKLGDLKAALASFSRCLDIDPYYGPCVGNQVSALAALGRDADALSAYRNALNAGAVSISLSLPLLVRTGHEFEFKTATGSSSLLFGWRRHDELYQAFRHPERTYPELIADIRNFDQKKIKPMTEEDLSSLLVPLGDYDFRANSFEYWDASYTGYRHSEQFRSMVQKSGVLDYWRKHGFPPQCHAVGADDFACN
jgi:TolB-like protein/Tfp pilus assembly protein PilF